MWNSKVVVMVFLPHPKVLELQAPLVDQASMVLEKGLTKWNNNCHKRTKRDNGNM